jgi:hypothetical protein
VKSARLLSTLAALTVSLTAISITPNARADEPATPAPADPEEDEPTQDGTKQGGTKQDGTKQDEAKPASDATPMSPPEHPEVLPAGPEVPSGDKRDPQNYDNRPDTTTTGEDALWVPRVLFAPLYFVTDIVVRRPLGALVMAVERGDVISKVTDFFAFGPNHGVGIVPTAFYDFGFRPSIGLYYFYDDLFAPHNNLRATISTGGEKYLKARIVDRIPLHVEKDADGVEVVRTYAQVEVDGLARADYLYYGVGWNTPESNESTYEQRTVGGGARVHVEPVKGSFVESWFLARGHLFSDGECEPERIEGRVRCADRPLLGAVDEGLYPRPDGFDGFTTLKVGARGVLDTRRARPAPGSGIGAEARVELATDVDTPGSWIQAGASLGGFIDLTGARRVLGLTLDARMIQPFDDYRVPFTELIGTLRTDGVPDDDLIRGFTPGRLLGESSVVATLEYSWPIWSFVDATMQAQVGNVFARNFEDFDFERLRFSFVGGFRSPNHRDHALNLLVGFGTAPFVLGGEPDSLRFLIGGTTGF